MADSLRELQVVQAEVAKFVKAEVDSVGVRLINRFLVVTLINSPLTDAKEIEKRGKAKELAWVAYQSYKRRADVRQVDVEFVTTRTYLGIFNTSSSETLTFPVDELKQDGPPTGTQPRPEQEREACRAEKAALGRRMSEVFRDFQAVPDPAPIEVLVGIDQRIRGLLRDRSDYRSCGTDRELIYDKRWDAMGVKVGYHQDLAYTGQLLVAAHRSNPNSPWRGHTLFSTVFGETPPHGLGVMPDIKAAQAYETEFPKGPYIADVYRTIADFHKDLYMVLRDGRSGYKYDCFAPYIRSGPWRDQADRAREMALEYYQRVLRLIPKDARARAWHEETRKGVVRAWSFCAD